MRGITLAEISESTKISRRWLKALEDEEFELLPGGVFNRGFVRAYAHFLGIDEEQAVADYVTASNEQQPPEDKFPLEIHEKPGAPPLNPKRSVLPVLLSVLALVMVISGWTFWIRHKAQESAAANRQSWTVTAPPSSAASTKTSDSGSTSSTPNPSSPTEVAGISEPSAADNGGSGVAQSAPNDPQNSPRVIHIKSSSTGPNQGGSFSVVIKAKQNSWISIAADGHVLWEGTLSANNERSVTADKELVLKTGNAAGIEVSYNGKALGTLGKDKQVRTLTFNTAGLEQ